MELGGSQGMGVVSKSWFYRGLLSLSSLRVRTLMSTDAQTSLLGTPLVSPWKRAGRAARRGRRLGRAGSHQGETLV